MARKIGEKQTDIIYDEDLIDEVDEKLEQTPEIVSDDKEEDYDLDEMFDNLDMDDYITDSQDTTKVVQKQKKAESVRPKPKLVKNPFEQSSKQQTKATYNEIVDDDFDVPRMDVRPYTPVPVKKSKNRFKMWLVTGVLGVSMLACATLIGVLGVGAGAGTNAIGANSVETGELASDQGIINRTDSPLTEEQVQDWLSGRNVPHNVSSGNASNSQYHSQQIVTNSSMWDKFCDFFSRLFGR